jgi:hypothetical protein
MLGLAKIELLPYDEPFNLSSDRTAESGVGVDKVSLMQRA